MANRNFKLREQDYKAMLDMTEKQAGQFIKGLCGYAFDGVPMETKGAKIAPAYAYAKTALDISFKSRENGRKGGLLVAERMRGAKASPVKPSAAESDPMGRITGCVITAQTGRSVWNNRRKNTSRGLRKYLPKYIECSKTTERCG